jgi:hypothetical protein
MWKRRRLWANEQKWHDLVPSFLGAFIQELQRLSIPVNRVKLKLAHGAPPADGG